MFHLKHSIAANSGTVLEKMVPKCSTTVFGGKKKTTTNNRVRLGHFKDTELLNGIFRAAAACSSGRGGKCFS